MPLAPGEWGAGDPILLPDGVSGLERHLSCLEEVVCESIKVCYSNPIVFWSG